jgi:hypothetical protein
MEERGDAAARSGELARAIVATALIAVTLAALAIAGLIHGRGSAMAQSRVPLAVSAPAPAASLSHFAVNPGNLGLFAFGHVEFDWNPTASGGVPGFDSWPPASRQ